MFSLIYTFLVVILFVDNYAAQETASTAGTCTGTVAFPQARHPRFEPCTACRALPDTSIASLPRSWLFAKDPDGDAELLRMELPLWPFMWEETFLLPRLSRTLDLWNATFERTKVSACLCLLKPIRMVMGLAFRCTATWTRRQATWTEALDEKCKCACQSSQREEQRAAGRHQLSLRTNQFLTLAYHGADHQQHHTFSTAAAFDTICHCVDPRQQRCRADSSSQVGVPRLDEGSIEHTDRSCQSRKKDYAKTVGVWTSQNVQRSEQRVQRAESTQGRQVQTQRTMAETSPRLCALVGATIEALHRATSQLQWPHTKSTPRSWCSQADPGRPQQEGRRRQRPGCNPRRSHNWRCRSPGLGPTGPDGATGMHQSRVQRRNHGNLGRRDCGASQQASAICGTIGWFCQAWGLIYGSDSPCLFRENGYRVPSPFEPQLADGTEAYLVYGQGAACVEAAPASFLCPATACHSAIWDPNFRFLDTFAALGQALQLQGEVLLTTNRRSLTLTTSRSNLIYL